LTATNVVGFLTKSVVLASQISQCLNVNLFGKNQHHQMSTNNNNNDNPKKRKRINSSNNDSIATTKTVLLQGRDDAASSLWAWGKEIKTYLQTNFDTNYVAKHRMAFGFQPQLPS